MCHTVISDKILATAGLLVDLCERTDRQTDTQTVIHINELQLQLGLATIINVIIQKQRPIGPIAYMKQVLLIVS